jgi:hypothetical protein
MPKAFGAALKPFASPIANDNKGEPSASQLLSFVVDNETTRLLSPTANNTFVSFCV